MGGCCSFNKKPKDSIIDVKKVQEIKSRLKEERMRGSYKPWSDETQALIKKAN